MFSYIVWFIIIAIFVAAWLIWALARPKLFARRVRNALKQFDKNRQQLESEFVRSAEATGKPRGLSWKECGFQPDILLARDRANGHFVALVGVTIRFEAVQGGGMEDVEAVGNLRAATAVFDWNGREWSTQGRAVFNLEPREVLQRYRGSLDPVRN